MIELISDHLEVIPTLTDWYQSEWEPYYGKAGPGDARADLESRCSAEGHRIAIAERRHADRIDPLVRP